jgi:PKD repeat protein
MVRAFRTLTLLATVAVAAGCSIENTTAPALSGPSELGLSLSLAASPDILAQDGASRSDLRILSFDANGKPKPGVTLRLEVTQGGQIVDFGTLSQKTVTTGNDGVAAASYTAPRTPAAPVDTGTLVTILATPIGSNYANSVPRAVDIRLVPTGVIIPPSDLVAGFTFTPASPAAQDPVVFTASWCANGASTDCTAGSVTSWSWSFGDGGTATGQVVTHQFAAGVWPVTLTVKDPANRAVSTTKTIVVATGTNPTASFVFSPSAPVVGQTVFFNGVASSATGNRTIVDYQWNFGNGHTARGVTATHAFEVAGSYTVTLTVVDDAGRAATSTATIVIAVPK